MKHAILAAAAIVALELRCPAGYWITDVQADVHGIDVRFETSLPPPHVVGVFEMATIGLGFDCPLRFVTTSTHSARIEGDFVSYEHSVVKVFSSDITNGWRGVCGTRSPGHWKPYTDDELAAHREWCRKQFSPMGPEITKADIERERTLHNKIGVLEYTNDVPVWVGVDRSDREISQYLHNTLRYGRITTASADDRFDDPTAACWMNSMTTNSSQCWPVRRRLKTLSSNGRTVVRPDWEGRPFMDYAPTNAEPRRIYWEGIPD